MRHAHLITTTDSPQPSGAYSQAVSAPPFVFLSGQGPFNPTTRELIEGDTETQLRAIMTNLDAVARAAGGSLADAVKFGVFLRDLDDLPVVNKVFSETLSAPFPSRTTVQSNLTRFSVEVDVILFLPA